MNSCLVIGHRGAPRHAPENTLAGFREAIRLGVDMIELDVRLSRDRTPVVRHGSRFRGLARMVTVERLKAALLRRLDVGEGFGPGFSPAQIPTLKEAVRLTLPRVQMNIELKPVRRQESALVRAVLRVVPKHSDGKVLYSSFSERTLALLRRMRPDARCGLLFSGRWRFHVAEAKRLGCFSIHPKKNLCRPARIQAAQERGLKVMVWTVNDSARMRELLRWGVDGMFTDTPEILIPLCRKAQSRYSGNWRN